METEHSLAGEARYSEKDINVYLADAITVDPVQPSPETIARIEQTFAIESPDIQPSVGFSESELPRPSSQVALNHDVPFATYLYGKHEDRYIFHPMQAAGFLRHNAAGSKAGDIARAIAMLGVELPNGGLAWYYPRHFNVSRMLGTRLKYSAIAQGALVVGLAATAENHADVDPSLAEKALLALKWPFERGGVNLEDVALLEMPSFDGPPEIILNGWLDALLNLRVLANDTGNSEAESIFRRNVSFLARILASFDAADAGISRYSDVSPYRANVTLIRPEDIDTLRLLYIPRLPELKPVQVQLRQAGEGERSVYDNAILQRQGSTAVIQLSCSQHYETLLVSKSPAMGLSMLKGRVDRTASTPSASGDPVTLKSAEIDGGSYVSLGPETGLICGYPTNFTKAGKNSYHVYHVVALLVLALGSDVDEDERQVLLSWALKWNDDINALKTNEGLAFQDPDQTLISINTDRRLVPHAKFAELLAEAKRVASSPQAARQ